MSSLRGAEPGNTSTGPKRSSWARRNSGILPEAPMSEIPYCVLAQTRDQTGGAVQV
jgi:hypothetical protein